MNFYSNDVYGNSQVVEVATTTELKNAINSAKPKTTILLKDGKYTYVNIEFPKGLHDVVIKAKGNNAVIVPKGYDDKSAFTLPNVARVSEQVHDISFVGFKVEGKTTSWKQFVKSVHGRWVDSGGNLHDYGDDNPKYGPYNIYFKNIETNNLFMGLYSGLHAHDWTVDSCIAKNSTMSHFWYMMGWHLAVVNSTFEDATHDALAIRGYYPDGEVHTYIGKEDSKECYGNKYVKDRGSRSVENGFLPADDWTHIIRNNTFKRITTIRGDWNSYVPIAYSIYSDDAVCGAERTYMPPQNIEISGNLFDNRGEESDAINSAIAVDAYSGINNDSLASVNGISIFDNTFIRVKSSEEFIVTNDSNTDLSKLDKDKVKNNKIIDK